MTRLTFVADPDQGLPQFRIAVEKPPEVLSIQDQQTAFLYRHDGRDPVPMFDQRDLAEKISSVKDYRFGVQFDLQGAAHDKIHAVGVITLAHDDLPGAGHARFQHCRQIRYPRRRQIRE